MTASATIAVMAAALGICVTALCRALARAPGWSDLRLFSYVCVTAAIYCALSIPSNLGAPGPQVVLCARLQIVVAGVHVAAWLRYAADHLRSAPARWERWYRRGLLAGCASALVPGLAYEGAARTRAFSPLGLLYAHAVPTTWGVALFAALLGVFGLLTFRYGRAWWRGEPQAAVHCGGLLALMLLGVNDALAVASPLRLPHLLELGCVIPVGAVAYSLVARFAADARDLACLRDDLETRVAERTRELACAVDALHRSEKLAAMGQLAAGVAHEVNNPVAVVIGNLQFLGGALERGRIPPEAASCIADSLTATGRISHIARQLLQAGRLAGTTEPCENVSVAAAAAEAIRAAQARCGPHVRFQSLVPPHLAILAREDALVQVLMNLLVNAGDAIPESRKEGRVVLRAERAARVRIVVEDNGTGMSAETLARAFEPFFSTKPFGSGTGLGLAVSRGLVEGLGGELWLESELGSGTRALIELPGAPPARAEPEEPVPEPTPERALASASGANPGRQWVPS